MGVVAGVWRSRTASRALAVSLQAAIQPSSLPASQPASNCWVGSPVGLCWLRRLLARVVYSMWARWRRASWVGVCLVLGRALSAHGMPLLRPSGSVAGVRLAFIGGPLGGGC